MNINEYFKNRKEAAQWLEAEGYPVKQSKFYEDCPGDVPLNDDKTVSKFLVMQYGEAQRRKIAGGNGAGTFAEAAEADLRKKIADAGIAERKERKLGREEDGLWLYADDAYAMLAGLVARIRSAVRHQAYSRRRELVEIAGGNPDKADEVYQEIEGFIDAGLNEVAGGDVKGKFHSMSNK